MIPGMSKKATERTVLILVTWTGQVLYDDTDDQDEDKFTLL